MTRTRASAKAAGSRFERLIADYLADVVDERIDRRVKTGSKDRGDIAGLRMHGQRIVLELKDCAQPKIGPWLNEAEIERLNDDALAGAVVYKRYGFGQPHEQIVVMTVENLVALINGSRP